MWSRILGLPPVYQQVMIKGFGTGFNLEEMGEESEGKEIKGVIKQFIQFFQKSVHKALNAFF